MTTLLALALLSAGQFRPPGQPGGASPADEHARRIEARKEARDEVLRAVGNEALGFTKRYGDLGVQALQACQPDTARALVALHNSGGLAKLRDPKAALEAVKKHGDPVAAWLVANHKLLEDPDALECFASEPLEFVYDLRDVAREAEARRASRKGQPAPGQQPAGEFFAPGREWYRDPANLTLGAVVAACVFFAVLARRRKAGAEP